VKNGDRVLDFGCGEAPYLTDFAVRGCVVAGAELDADIVEAHRRRGLDVRVIDDPNLIPFEPATFDVVYLTQVIEHLREPHTAFAELNRVTRSGGAVYLACPDGASPWKRVLGDKWVSGWFAPFHLFVYTAPVLSRLAQAHGFEVVRWWSTTPASWCQLNLRALLKPSSRRLEEEFHAAVDAWPMRVVVAVLTRILDLALREGDCLVIQLRKHGDEGAGR
jgi:SAM-dependent methyltransferase